ncbi:hypothetical protein BDA96_02G298500 [Sorghum bicolor]|nr:hypothetical protein BDA96_02G298500 [Sorghum bicolor]
MFFFGGWCCLLGHGVGLFPPGIRKHEGLSMYDFVIPGLIQGLRVYGLYNSYQYPCRVCCTSEELITGKS